MAESSSARLAKSVQKHAGRAKEKILQNLGKVDRTADEIFDEHLTNFNRQLNSANKLQKEFNNYIRCIRAVQVASKSLMDAICEVYEGHWTGNEAFNAQADATEALWQDFSHKLGDQVLIPLNTYTAQFQEMKKKIEKRNRKLIDYDGQRHSFQNLQANASKRKDDVKLTKGREQLEEARRTYEILNTELHDELPALFDSRILFLVTNLQTLFASEQVFHNETAKIYSELEAIVDKLATDSQRGSYTLKKSPGNAISSSPVSSPTLKALNNSNAVVNNSYPKPLTNGSSNANSPTSTASSSQPDQSSSITTPQTPSPTAPHEDASPKISTTDENIKNLNQTTIKNDNEPSYQNTADILSVEKLTVANNSNIEKDEDEEEVTENEKNANTTITSTVTNNLTAAPTDGAVSAAVAVNATAAAVLPPAPPTKPEHTNGNVQKSGDGKKASNPSAAVLGATTTDLPPGVLYRVKATYSYVKEDADELSFEVGDLIEVIEYDDPEDQEEGWLMGQKEGTEEKGLFPANFTRPI